MFKRIAFSNIGIIENENAKELLTVSNDKEVLSFKYDPNNFIYFRCRAITADVPNKNGDLFPEEEIIKSYKTFIGVGVYKDHDANSVNKAVGKILWADYIPEGKYVELIGCIDKKLDPELARRVQTGIIDSCSMGCVVKEAECSICHNIARNPSQLCRHMHPTYGIKGTIDANGNIVYEINRGIQFTELSLVTSPADSTAKLFEVIASLKKNAQESNKASIVDVAWFRDISNYTNENLLDMYKKLEKISSIQPKNDKEKLIKNSAIKLIELYNKIGIFNQSINESEFKKMVYNLFYLADPRIYDLMNFYIKYKNKSKATGITKEISDVIKTGEEIYNEFIKIIEYLKSSGENINLKYAILYVLLNNIYFPTLPSDFKEKEEITSILDIFGEIPKLIRSYNLDAFSFPIHILGEPFYLKAKDLDLNKIATKDEQIFLSIIPPEYRAYALSYIRAMSYYLALGMLKAIGIDKFKENYRSVFGVDLDKEKINYLSNEKRIIDIYNKVNKINALEGSKNVGHYKEKVFNYILDGSLLLRSALLAKYENVPEHTLTRRFMYGNLTKEDLKSKNLIFLKNNYKYLKNPEIISMIRNLTDYSKNIYKTIHLVKDENVILNLLDILEKPSAFLNYTKFVNTMKKDDKIAEMFRNKKGFIIGNETIESITKDQIRDNYLKLKLFKSSLAKRRYEVLKKKIEEFTPFIELYKNFLEKVKSIILEIAKKGINAEIKLPEEYNKIMVFSGYIDEKEKVKKIGDIINSIIDKLRSIKSNLTIDKEHMVELQDSIKSEIDLYKRSIDMMGIITENENLDKYFIEIYSEIKKIKAIIIERYFKFLPNYKDIENKYLDIENKIKKTIDEYKKEVELKKGTGLFFELNKKFNNIYKQIINEILTFLEWLKGNVTNDLIKIRHEYLIKNRIKDFYEMIKKTIPEIKRAIESSNTKQAKIEFRFIKGFGFRTSLIEAKQGNRYVVKRLADIMPKEVMVELLNGNENVIGPDEIIEQLSKVVNNLEEFENFFKINNENEIVGGKGDSE
jgi:hypothetical protein